MKIMTITGIRPDFIRMAEIFRRFDEEFDHVLVHSGQHYDRMLSGVFFDELGIREPDYNLNVGPGNTHWEQSAELTVKVMKLAEQIKPELVVFIGDSNSVAVSFPLRKSGYRIGHIEAGMRSYDRRMLEETNRVVCDHCSELLFVYHDDYRQQALKENIPDEFIHVVGNTIVEIYNRFKPDIQEPPRRDYVLMDIHRPENFKDEQRLARILELGCHAGYTFDLPVRMLKFGQTMQALKNFHLDEGRIEFIDLMSYKEFLEAQYHACFLISDSGTAQEEPPLFDLPVIVPRDFTERPQSMTHGNSRLMDVHLANKVLTTEEIWEWVRETNKQTAFGKHMNTSWLGDGTTSQKIVDIIKA